MSTVPAASSSRSAAVNTPTPIFSTGSEDLSPAVFTITNSACCPAAISASRTVPAWVSASTLPRVPIRHGASVVPRRVMLCSWVSTPVAAPPNAVAVSALTADAPVRLRDGSW